MKCYRCGNAMILKKFYDYGGYFWAWKCGRCGGESTHKEETKGMNKNLNSLEFQMRTASDDEPAACGMIFCHNCNGSGRYFYADRGVSGCSFCGGFGLIEREKDCTEDGRREAVLS